MHQIAERAGISETLLHYYFRSKENIYRKVLTKVAGQFFGHLSANVHETDPFEEILRKFISSAIDHIAANPRVPLFVLQELSRGGKIVGEVLSNVFTDPQLAFPSRLIAIIRRERDAGRIAPVDPFQFMLTTVGSVLFYFLAEPIVRRIAGSVQPNAPYDPPAFLEARKAQIFEVLYLGIKNRETERRNP